MLGNNGSRIASFIIGFLPVSRWHGLKRWLLRTIGGISVGDGTRIWSGAKFNGRFITIGENCFISTGGRFMGLSEEASLTIGNYCNFGPDVYISTGAHAIGPSTHRGAIGRLAPISIGDGTGVSINCVVLAGVRIGKGCLIGPGVVVAQDVNDNMLLGQPTPRKIKLPDEAIEF